MNKTDNYILLVVLHIAIGIVLSFFESLSKLYFIIILVYFFSRIILSSKANKTNEVLLACAYLVGSEVLFRMTKGGLLYESSKYFVIVFLTMGMFYTGLSKKSYPYLFYLIALVPAILVASTTLSLGVNFRTNIAFVLSGPVCLGVGALFCYDRKITQKQLLNVIMNLALPSITMTTYLFLYSTSIKATLSGTASNAALSGGFGPNQVSTALGLGMFALVVRLFVKSPTLGLKVLNLFLLAAMTFRAIITFSRGGVYAAIIVIIAFLATIFFRSYSRQRARMIGMLVLFSIVLAMTWTISSNQTRGLIDKRYANETAAGVKKDDITTGRIELFLEEIDGFINNPFFGIGASRVKDVRVERSGHNLPSHNEVGRLLSEHGFLGIIILLILIFVPLAYRTHNKRNYYFYAFYCFWFATINHSGMRIAAPAFLYALVLLNVVNETSKLKKLSPKRMINSEQHVTVKKQ